MKAELAAIPDRTMTRDLYPVARRLYPSMPGDGEAFVAMCDELMGLGTWPPFWIVTAWIKRRGDLYGRRHFGVYERWLLAHTDGWGKCDVLCYRVLNPMMERHPTLRGRLMAWAADPRTYVRRAAAVALIQSTQSFAINVPFSEVEAICERLKGDPELHVQKGVGWLLKYTYLAHPEATVRYLEEHVGSLSRTTFRYALIKMPPALRHRLMALG